MAFRFFSKIFLFNRLKYPLEGKMRYRDSLPIVEDIQEIENNIDGLGGTWYSGTFVPNNTVGKDGDFYYNTITGNLYIKTDGIWTVTSLAGGDSGYTKIFQHMGA